MPHNKTETKVNNVDSMASKEYDSDLTYFCT